MATPPRPTPSTAQSSQPAQPAKSHAPHPANDMTSAHQVAPLRADVMEQHATTSHARPPQRAQEPPDRGTHIERLTTGFASPAEDYRDAPLDLQDLVVRHPSATFFLEMTGEAMLPTLRPHDILVIDRVLDPTPGALVVATVDGAFLVRRFQPGMHTVYLVADNPTAGAIRLHEEMEQQLWGVVTHLVRALGQPTPPPPTAA